MLSEDLRAGLPFFCWIWHASVQVLRQCAERGEYDSGLSDFTVLSKLVHARSRVQAQSLSSEAAKEKDLEDVSQKSGRFSIKTLDTAVPVERRSLSRGLAMNKFEKDFMIFPEYTDTDDVRNIEGFVEILRKSLDLSVDPKELEKEECLTTEVLETLQSNAAFALAVPKEFGGCGMVNKDTMKVFEELSKDWNIFANVWVPHVVGNLITIYGTEQQKEEFLPKIAQGKLRPAIALFKDVSASSCSVTQGTSGQSLISAEGVKVMGVHNANFFVVFGTSQNRSTNQEESSCYLVDVTALDEVSKLKFVRDTTLGLKAVDVGRVNITTQVKEGQVLGGVGNGKEIGSELIGSGRMPLAASAVGLAKRILRDVAVLCNKTPSRVAANSSLAEDSRAQRIVTNLALQVYGLESAVYYLAGMIDEGMTVVVDIENALISFLTRNLLESVVSVLLELGGVVSSDTSFPFEKLIRDISTLLSLVEDGADVEKIALATVATWTTSTGHQRITSTLKRFLKQESENEALRNPGLTHYIAEHAHPSLQKACQDLEFSMSRINAVMSKMVGSKGKNIEQDYGSLEALVTVLKNNFVMVSTISRASRSYSIGLRNSDIELAWATMICSRLSRMTWFELDALSDLFGLVKLNPSLLAAGRAVFDLGGYVIESPLERNW
ncbi:unnamed protein product [Caenorhabditis auriculariae]|uniref:Uncharacterized protein n=1 Tax=Caenorhabditis auriculariae TaxID=2777116 RepID=A0A8S1HY71_9PELO|nr:unnamed protein product [Caenorhabditis auriculariae]